MNRNKLYAFLLAVCTAGYAWLAFSGKVIHEQHSFRMCLWYAITGLPCPSCGMTRSAVAILNGDIRGALLLNPLGFPALLFLLVTPVWILTDLILRRQSFYKEYRRAETILRKPFVAIIAVILVLANWVWNIYKEG